MKNNLENKIFLFLGIDKFTIVALNSIDEEVYKEEILKDNKNNQIDLDFLDNFLNENIFKIEKKLNEFVKNIFLIIDHQNIFSIHLSIKNKFDNININLDSIHKLLLEAKSCCKKTLEDLDILHMKIDQFYIDGTYFKTLPEKKIVIISQLMSVIYVYLKRFQKLLKMSLESTKYHWIEF